MPLNIRRLLIEGYSTQVDRCLSGKAGYRLGTLIGAGGSAKASRGEIVS